MGTRGTVTLIYKGKRYTWYNHWDSYFSGLGRELILDMQKMLKLFTMEQIKQLVGRLTLVDSSMTPTAEQIAALAPSADLSVSSQSTSDWYCLLRKNQDRLINTLLCGYILHETQYEEYNYVLDFDNNLFYEERFVDHRAPLDSVNEKWVEEADQLQKAEEEKEEEI